MKHLEKEKQTKRLRKSRIFATLICFCVVVLSIAQIIVANQTASSGERVKRMEEEKEKLQEENRKLETEIAKLSSLGTIEKQAEKLGFVKTTSIVFLTVPPPVALKRE